MTLSTVLKMLGVKIAPEQIAQLEIVIPQIPQRAAAVITYVNDSVARFDRRLADVELTQQTILRKLDAIYDLVLMGREEDGRPAGEGATAALQRSNSAKLPSTLQEADRRQAPVSDIDSRV